MERRRFLQIFTVAGAFLAGLFRPSTVEAQVAPTVTADPAELTLPPGGSAMVMVSVDPASPYGVGSVTIPVTVPDPYDGTIEGDTSVTVPAGQHWHVTGNVNLTGDLIVEGLLTGVDTFEVQGNGFQILVQNGGQLDLAGVPKSGWVDWDIPVIGWLPGDRLAVAPTAWQKTLLLPLTSWAGDWAGMTRPVDAPDVTLIDGSVQRPEVANLDRTITFRNLRRLHFLGAGVQTLKHFAVVDSGTAGVLGDYPIHFHLNGEASRGSLLEGVVVEGGKNHAFVPHGSHGVTMRDCVAYNTIGNVYWWDPPTVKTDPLDPNNSNDLLFDRCLALVANSNSDRLTAFTIGGGTNNEWVGCVAVGVQGGKNSSGYNWQENFVAVFDGGNKAHNNRRNGIFTWSNSSSLHVIDGFVSYHNRRFGISHGSYVNRFVYRNVVNHVGVPIASGSDETATIGESAIGAILFENIVTDDRLLVLQHSLPASPVTHRNCSYTGVVYREGTAPDEDPSEIHFEDCGLTPADFNMVGARPGSIAKIYEGGVLTHRWAAGAWS